MINPYINFKGNCREAVEFYAEVFQTELQPIMLYGDHESSEYPLSDEAKNMIMHTFLNIQGNRLMFSDVPDGMPYTVGNNITLTIVSEDIEEVKALYEKLKVEGTVVMEFQETVWSKGYGNVIDKFGIGWQVNVETEF